MDRQEFTQRYLRPIDGADTVPRLAAEEIPEFRALCSELGFIGMGSCLINEGAPGSIGQLLRFSGFDERRLMESGVMAGPYLTTGESGEASQYPGFMLFEPSGEEVDSRPEAA